MTRICRYDMKRYILPYEDGYYLDSLLERDAICVINPRRYTMPRGFVIKKTNYCFEKPQLDDMVGFCKSLNLKFASFMGYVLRGAMISDDEALSDISNFLIPAGKITNIVTGEPIQKVRRITEVSVPYVDNSMLDVLFEKPPIKELLDNGRSKTSILSAIMKHWYEKQVWGVTYENMAFPLDFKVYMYAHPENRDKGVHKYVLFQKGNFEKEIKERTEPTVKALINRALSNFNK